MGAFSDFALIPEQGVQPTLEQLPGEMQAQIRQMAGKLPLADAARVSAFGAKAQREMSAFSDIALRQMLSEDIAPLDSLMHELVEQIRACSFVAEAQGLLRRLTGGAPSLAQVKAAYQKAEPRINEHANALTDRRVALMRDSALLDRLYERNEVLYRELCSLIVVGEEAARQAEEAGVSEPHRQRLSRRLEDLRITKAASTQLAAQIRLVQQNDQLTAERLQAVLEITIPLWKAQMATALGLARAGESGRLAERVGREGERSLRQGARDLAAQRAALKKDDPKEQAEETARQLLSELDEIERTLREQAALRGAGEQ